MPYLELFAFVVTRVLVCLALAGGWYLWKQKTEFRDAKIRLPETAHPFLERFSDVLKTLPQVDIDPQGNLSLRGDANVTTLVDGKKSARFSQQPGDAMQQMPASVVERIEVIPNPPAEFRAEGTSGIINMVMKKDRDLPPQGIVRINAGSEGRFGGPPGW